MLMSPNIHGAAARGRAAGRLSRLFEFLAAPQWMLAFFLFAALAGVVSVYVPAWITAIWVLPLGIFALSVIAAVLVRPRLRRDPALLGLHLALLVLIVLVGIERLAYFDGAATLSDGAVFSGELHLDERGPLHPDRVASLRFANEGFVEDYADRDRWRATYNRVRVWDERGHSHVTQIGDDAPLQLNGYRIFTTFNRGYSPVFHWQPAQGAPQMGTVQLYPNAKAWMANDWRLPSGPTAWVLLEPEQSVNIQRGERRTNMGAAELAHRVVLRVGEQRWTLRPGESADLPGGRLTYVRLGVWMGYRIVYDFAAHWLASAAAAMVLCLLVFYARLLFRTAEGASGASEREGVKACV